MGDGSVDDTASGRWVDGWPSAHRARGTRAGDGRPRARGVARGLVWCRVPGPTGRPTDRRRLRRPTLATSLPWPDAASTSSRSTTSRPCSAISPSRATQGTPAGSPGPRSRSPWPTPGGGDWSEPTSPARPSSRRRPSTRGSAEPSPPTRRRPSEAALAGLPLGKPSALVFPSSKKGLLDPSVMHNRLRCIGERAGRSIVTPSELRRSASRKSSDLSTPRRCAHRCTSAAFASSTPKLSLVVQRVSQV